jgi:RNA polymerase sigma-70 factor (ECF subfamily)
MECGEKGVEVVRHTSILNPVPAAANGSPAFWQTRPGPDSVCTPFGLVLLDVFEGLVSGITTYLDADRLIPLFGAPADSTPSPQVLPSRR